MVTSDQHQEIVRLSEQATDQGLDPIAAALVAAGIPFEVCSTGGNCMAIKVPLTEGATSFVWLTNASVNYGEDDLYTDTAAIAGRYWNCLDDDACEGQCEGRDLVLYTWGRGDEGCSIHELDELPQALRENMDGSPCPCGRS